jgi:hypothetical protein
MLYKLLFFSFKKFAFAEIYRVIFAGKSVKQFYRFTGKFSVKAQPYLRPLALLLRE